MKKLHPSLTPPVQLLYEESVIRSLIADLTEALHPRVIFTEDTEAMRIEATDKRVALIESTLATLKRHPCFANGLF